MTPAATRRGRVFVISSPSGGGKTTVVNALMRRMRRLARSVSVTTRPARPGERDGRDYRFISPRAFRALQRRGRLLEWARVHGQYYGTPKQPLMEALARGRDAILSIDVQGARQVRRMLGRNAVLIFLLPPSLDQLQRRLVKRRTEGAATIRKRMTAARREMACAAWYDHCVINDRLDQALHELQAIIRGRPIHSTQGEGGSWRRYQSKSC